MEQIVLRETTRHVQDNRGIRPSQHGFTKGRSCLTNRISSNDLVTHLVDERKAVDVVYLDFSKAFDTAPLISLLPSRFHSFNLHPALFLLHLMLPFLL